MKVDIYMSEAQKQVIAVSADGIPPEAGSSFRFIDYVEHPKIGDRLGWSGNHALWHHIRDVLYTQGVRDFSKYKITFRGDGAPNVPKPIPEPTPSVHAFQNKEFTQIWESDEMTAPNGETNAMLGFCVHFAAKHGKRWASISNLGGLKVTFGDVPMGIVFHNDNGQGYFIMFCRNSAPLPTTGKIKITIEDHATPALQLVIGPMMGQISFVTPGFQLRPQSNTKNVTNRFMSTPVLGAAATQFWASLHRPHWACGPHIPGALTEKMMDFTIEQSAMVKGGEQWKPASVDWLEDRGRPGGSLAYDPVTGVFTLTHLRDAGHPTVGIVLKRTEIMDAGHFYIEFQAKPEDFSLQEEGTDNISITLARYQAGDEPGLPRNGNNRDSARIRRIYTEADPLYQSVIEPSDTVVGVQREGIIIFVRGLNVGHNVKFKIIQKGSAMRAAIGKTAVPFGTERTVNVSIADWRIMETDDKEAACLMACGSTLPDSSIPV